MAINKEIDLRFAFGYTPLEFRDTLHMLAEGKVDPAPAAHRHGRARRRRGGLRRAGRARDPRQDPDRPAEHSKHRIRALTCRGRRLECTALGARRLAGPLDDHQCIAVGIAEPEQRWDRVAHPADLRGPRRRHGLEIGVVGIDVVGLQADPGLDVAGRPCRAAAERWRSWSRPPALVRPRPIGTRPRRGCQCASRSRACRRRMSIARSWSETGTTTVLIVSMWVLVVLTTASLVDCNH